MRKEVAYFNVMNVKYAIGGVIKDIVGAKSISLPVKITTNPLYADGIKIFEAVSDQGIDGALGLTTQPKDYENALGLLMQLVVGMAQLAQTSAKMHNIYFEYEIGFDDQSSDVAKTWLFGVTTQKASRTHSTKTENTEFGEYSMPLKAVPQIIFAADGETPLRDASGKIQRTSILTLLPGETGYDTFELSVPVLKVPASTPAVLKPYATPGSGEIADNSTVALACDTPGALIYYTMDGSTPTTGSTLYTAPIAVTDSMAIKAIAAKAGMSNSAVMTELYIVT